MGHPSHFLILLLSVASSLPFAMPSRQPDAAPAICSRTDYPNICSYAAKTYGHGRRTITTASLLAMHIQMATDHTQTAKAVASLFISKPDTSPRNKQAYQICRQLYEDALDDLVKGSKAIAARDAGTSNSMLSAVISYYNTCDDAFKEMNANNPLEKQDDFLSKMVSNALALGHVMLSKGA